ncbi:MAG: UDP-N-acetylmuramoyl-tripeptide--D-alanyl-D-alanine ligase [Verrucomicrobiota bacterium]
MSRFRPEELSKWGSAAWKNGVPSGGIAGISNDTRTIRPGDLYVAIQGENFDGHDFVRQAFEKGAAGALVNDGFQWSGNPVLPVPDTIKGLQDIARGYRAEWVATVVGITGSVGKTTVKEMCAAMLSVKGETHRTAGNYNNHIGLPLSMLAMPREARFGVFEIGMNHPGEIAVLTDLLRPDIGILTDICNAHRESFESLEGIAREKAELAWRVPGDGLVFLDCDSDWFELIRAKTLASIRTISFGSNADYTGNASASDVLSVAHHEFSMPLPGEHIMRNALRAIALGLELGMTPAEVEQGLGRFELPSMRWEESEVRGIRFINDAYNANPLSMRANLGTFANLSGEGGKWAVIGGMRELGDTAEKEHAELGRFIDGLNLDGVIVVGELGRGIASHVGQAVFQTLEVAEAAQILRDHLHPGDCVLLKASRGERLEQVLEHFKEI